MPNATSLTCCRTPKAPPRLPHLTAVLAQEERQEDAAMDVGDLLREMLSPFRRFAGRSSSSRWHGARCGARATVVKREVIAEKLANASRRLEAVEHSTPVGFITNPYPKTTS